MTEQMCALPVQCSRCGELFNLSYDLARDSGEIQLEEVVRALRMRKAVRKPLLCWDCRN